MTAIPPSRYKVVERGRRLVVIDTHTGQPATRDPAAPIPPRPEPASDRPIASSAPRSIDDRSGSAILTTSRFYDLKGPRRIVMTDTVSNRLSRALGGGFVVLICYIIVAIFFPLLWALPVILLLQPKTRTAFRSWMTARLDAADQAAS